MTSARTGTSRWSAELPLLLAFAAGMTLRVLQLRDQILAFGNIDAQRFFQKYRFTGVCRRQRIGFTRQRRAGQINRIGCGDGRA